jgi:hypothetical protein
MKGITLGRYNNSLSDSFASLAGTFLSIGTIVLSDLPPIGPKSWFLNIDIPAIIPK